MSMGHAAAYADIIEEKDLVTIGNCGKLLKKLKKLSDDALFNLVNEVEFGDPKLCLQCVKVLNAIHREFNKVTGLTLNLGYHDPDDGDRYDEVEGIYWSVDGMYQLSRAGKKYNKIVERKFFVNFG